MTEGNGAPVGPTIGAGLSAAGGAGYSFDPDQIAALIPKWEEFRDGIDDDQSRLRVALQQATPPSADQPAQTNALQVRTSIQAAIDHNANLRQYAQAWIDTLRKANGTYRNQDDETQKGLNSASGTADGTGLYE